MPAYTDQELLDQLHKLNWNTLFSLDTNSPESTSSVTVAKQHLKTVKQRVNEAQKEIRARWDGRKRDEAEIERNQLAPYLTLADAIKDLELTLVGFGEAVKLKIPFHGRSNLGTVLYGPDGERWRIGTPRDALNFYYQVRQQQGDLKIRQLTILRSKLEDNLHKNTLIRAVLIPSSIVFFITFVGALIILPLTTQMSQETVPFLLLTGFLPIIVYPLHCASEYVSKNKRLIAALDETQKEISRERHNYNEREKAYHRRLLTLEQIE